MTITWPWINDKSTNDQRFVQLAYDVARLTNALDVATQHATAMEQRMAQLEAIAKAQTVAGAEYCADEYRHSVTAVRGGW